MSVQEYQRRKEKVCQNEEVRRAISLYHLYCPLETQAPGCITSPIAGRPECLGHVRVQLGGFARFSVPCSKAKPQ